MSLPPNTAKLNGIVFTFTHLRPHKEVTCLENENSQFETGRIFQISLSKFLKTLLVQSLCSAFEDRTDLQFSSEVL